ncbi:hypothetical protein JCM8208_001082 [Rhodotorula glutinis]
MAAAATATSDDDDDHVRQLAPPPSYASLASPLVPQQAFHPQHGHHLQHADPRPVHPAFDHAFGDTLHLPRGCFLVRNAAQGKALDLLKHRVDEGAQIGLHPIKQPQLKGLSLQHSGSNQLFFLSWDGHLVSAAASRDVDVQDNRLVLTFPHPITTYPSPLSHPPPRFRLDPSTSTLHVLYGADPSFTGPDDSSDWRDDDYIVEAVPLKRKPAEPPLWATTQANQILSAVGSRAVNLGARVGDLLGRRFSQPASPNLDGGPSLRRKQSDELPLPPPPPPDKTPDKEVPPVPSTSRLSPPPRSSTSPLPATPPADDADSDSDSEPSAYRPVRVVRLAPNWRDKFPADALRAAPNTSFGVTRWPSSAKELRMWRRRQWDVVPVTVRPVPTSSTRAADEDGYVLPSDEGSEPSSGDGVPRSRSDSMSYFDGVEPSPGVVTGELYGEGTSDDGDDDAAEITSTDFSPLAMSATEGMPPSPSGSALGRPSQLAGLSLGGVEPTASSRTSGASPSRHTSTVTSPHTHHPLPLPPSPPLPSVPFPSTSTSTSSRPVTPEPSAAALAAADDEAEMRTPRPDDHVGVTRASRPHWGRAEGEEEAEAEEVRAGPESPLAALQQSAAAAELGEGEGEREREQEEGETEEEGGGQSAEGPAVEEVLEGRQ